MVRGRGGEQCVLPQRFVIDERFVVACGEEFRRPRLESQGPIVRLQVLLTPAVSVEVVHYVAAPYDEHALVAQGGEVTGKVVMILGRLRFVDGELHDGNVRFGEDVTEHRPRAVIEAPML